MVSIIINKLNKGKNALASSLLNLCYIVINTFNFNKKYTYFYFFSKQKTNLLFCLFFFFVNISFIVSKMRDRLCHCYPTQSKFVLITAFTIIRHLINKDWMFHHCHHLFIFFLLNKQ